MVRTQYPAEDVYVANFFSADNPTQLQIPHYQRGYSWGTNQLEQFWDDLCENLKINDEYFFGTIMTTGRDDSGGVEIHKIVDGQQRMMTTAILLTCIRDIFFEQDSPLVDEVDKEIFNHTKNPTNDLYYKIRLDDDDDRYSKDMIFRKQKNKLALIEEFTPEFESNTNLKNAYTFLFKGITKVIDEEQMSEPSKRDYLNSLRTVIKNKYTIINLNVRKTSKAYTLFDRINNRGLKLDASDLVKDLLFSNIDEERGSPSGSMSIGDAIKKWDEISRKMKKRKSRLNDFLHHYLNAYHTKNVNGEFVNRNKNNTYADIEEIIIDKIETAGNILNDLYSKHQDYTSLKKGKHRNITQKAENNLYWIEKMGVKIVYPVLLVGLKKYSKSDFEKLTDLCLKFFFRTKTISNENATALEKNLAEIAFKILHENASFKEIHDILKKSPLNPSQPSFSRDLSEARLGGSAARYLLTRIVEKMQSPRTVDFNTKSLELEHIMPTNYAPWKEYIKIHNADEIADNNESDIRTCHQNHVNKIGNLTLIDKEKNKIVSNDPYDKKLKEYKKSAIKITKDLQKYKIWNSASIEKRQKKLVTIGAEIWKIE